MFGFRHLPRPADPCFGVGAGAVLPATRGLRFAVLGGVAPVLAALATCWLVSSCGGGLEADKSLTSHGAIAFNAKTGEADMVSGAASQSDADGQALGNCNGDGCAVIFKFYGTNTCAAVAVGQNRVWGAGSGLSKPNAEQVALARCRSKAGEACAIPKNQPPQCM